MCVFRESVRSLSKPAEIQTFFSKTDTFLVFTSREPCVVLTKFSFKLSAPIEPN